MSLELYRDGYRARDEKRAIGAGKVNRKRVGRAKEGLVAAR